MVFFAGVWLVGNIGRERGVLWHSLIMAYVSYLTRYIIYDDSYWMTISVFATAFIFDGYSKQWRTERPQRQKPVKRIAIWSTAIIIYLALWSSYFYFNGTITDSDGDEVPVHEAIHNFIRSPWWTDLKQTLYDTWVFAQHNGWQEIWKQIIDTMDADGEQNAYKVGVDLFGFVLKLNFLFVYSRYLESVPQLHRLKLNQPGKSCHWKIIRIKSRTPHKRRLHKNDLWKSNKPMKL